MLTGIAVPASSPPPLAGPGPAPQEDGISVVRRGDRIRLLVGQEMLAEYRTGFRPRPILFPLNAAGETGVSRHYPVDEAAPGEAEDHPHHTSVWFAHGDVNGLDYWSGKARIRHREIERLLPDGLVAINEWLDGQQVIATDRTTIRLTTTTGWRMIDWSTEITAAAEPLVFGDTKEGTFAIRTRPELRIHDRQGNPVAAARNSNGTTGKQIWGKAARWVHYQGIVDGAPIGLTLMDHAGNPRHPALWHARDYGLVAANPFGRHDLAGEPAGSGTLTLPAGETLTLRYAIVVWNDDPADPRIDELYQQFNRR